MEREFGDIPKHALPLSQDGSDSLLGRIIQNALSDFESVVIWASKVNASKIQDAIVETDQVTIKIDEVMSGPLGPAIRSLENGERVFACAGDHFSTHSWKAMEAFHEKKMFCASILVAHSSPFNDAATFQVQDDGIISSWERKSRSGTADLINVGCYIFDPTPVLQEIFSQISWHKEEKIFDSLIKMGLLGAYSSPEKGFNVNTVETYRSLIEHLE
ncbi:MAG: NDP-sugar synthase [Patescibacteria group bacterium UBA2103]